jgi:hypothetical protein
MRDVLMVAVPLIFNATATANAATILGRNAGTGGTTLSTSIAGNSNTVVVNVFDVDIPSGCMTDVESIEVGSTYLKSAGLIPNADGCLIFVGNTATFATWGTPTAANGDIGLLLPGAISKDFTVGGGGTLAPSGSPVGATWADPTPPTVLQVMVLSDAADTGFTGGLSGETVSVPLPTADVTYSVGSPCTVASPNPIPVDNTAVGTVGTPAVVDVSLNDNNTACDPLPGCAVYNTTVVIEPGSTAGGITASVDSAGVATVNATSAGTAIVTIESGCSPTCDPLGTDVTTWVPQTLTVTFSEPVGPCQTVNAIYDPGASAFFAGFFGGTAGGPGGPTGQGSQGPTISVYQVAAPSVCVATISNVQVQTTVTASPGFDPTNDHLTVAVVSDLSTFTIWGTPTAVSGQANITFPGAVSSGYTSGGGTLVPLIDATWSGGPSTSPIYIVVVADASESAPGESIAGSTPVLCVEFGDPDCPPAPSPKPADIVKLCVASAPQAGCALFGGAPSPTLFVAVSGPDGNVIPANSTSYPSNSVGGSDGSGYIRSYYTTTSGLVVTPDAGSWTPGSCGADAMQLPAGAVSIANGTYAATLGPNGSNWFPPAGLKSVTVYARHAATNDDATSGGSPGRVEVYVNSNVFMMLDGESFTWSVDDPDDLTTLTEVRCTADAAATVTWVSA